MYARRTTVKASPDKAEEARRVIEGTVIPGARQLAGFRGGYWLFDPSAGESVSFTFFDTREHLEGSETAAQQLRTSASGQIGADVTGVERYEVAAQDHPTST